MIFRISNLKSGMAVFFALMGLALAWAVPARAQTSILRDFVKVRGDQLVEGDRPFRFISWNIPNLHLVEDNLAFAGENPWRWPDRFEIADALASVRQMGGTVVRTYVLSVVRTNDVPGVLRHVLGPGKFNEEGFRALDEVLAAANRTGIRVIVPFVDNWSWWGGYAEYAGFRGKPKDAFWADPQIIADFKETIRHMVTRTNTVTGVIYRDDKAILCWETGNELQSPPAWTKNVAAYIKSLDTNHPVLDGFYATKLVRDESLDMPEVDIVGTHFYPDVSSSFAGLVRANAAKTKGRKPYFVGEFGFVPTSDMVACMDAVKETGTSGALIWSLRPHSRDGGYYWHSEPSGGNRYKAFHWPGSTAGDAYDERGFMPVVRRNAFEIRGLPVPAGAAPAAPYLLPIKNVAAISWQGSVGATGYGVERASNVQGPWTLAADRVDESAVQYRPLFADTMAGKGEWYYRIHAHNSSGVSMPSNVVGPVRVTCTTLVDECYDYSHLSARSPGVELQTGDCRKLKEDAHRFAGQANGSIIYQRPGVIQGCRLYAFFPGEIADFRFAISADGKNYEAVPASRQVFYQGTGDYGYWKPVLFSVVTPPTRGKLLKIEFASDAQIGRVEIDNE